MASIEKRHPKGKLRWYARYRDPGGAQRVQVFDGKVDAERSLTKVEAAKMTGSYIDQKRAAISFRTLAEEQWAAHSHNLAEDTTRVRKRSQLDRHIMPVLGGHAVGAIRPSTVAAAVAVWSRTLAPGTVAGRSGRFAESSMRPWPAGSWRRTRQRQSSHPPLHADATSISQMKT